MSFKIINHSFRNIMSKTNKNLIIFLITLIASVFLITPVLAVDYGQKATGVAAGLKSGEITNIVGNLIGAGLSLIGVLFFALMLFGGVTWMLARGNQEMEKKALNTITGAIIGIIIVVASYAITNFVFSGLEGNVGSKPVQKTCTSEHPTWSCKKIAECTIPGPYADILAKGDTWEKNLCSANDEICCGEVEDNGGNGAESCHAGSVSFDNFCVDVCEVDGELCNADGEPGLFCVGLCEIKNGGCVKKSELGSDEIECQKVSETSCDQMKNLANLCEWK